MKTGFSIMLWSLALFVSPISSYAQVPDGDPCHEFLDDFKAAKQKLRDIKKTGFNECRKKQCAEVEKEYQKVHALMPMCAYTCIELKKIVGSINPVDVYKFKYGLQIGLGKIAETAVKMTLEQRDDAISSLINSLIDALDKDKKIDEQKKKDIITNIIDTMDHIQSKSDDLEKALKEANDFYKNYEKNWRDAEAEYMKLKHELEACDEDFNTRDVEAPENFACPDPLYDRCREYYISPYWNW